ncbi:MAG: sulfate transporter CysZ [Pseudomonadales bacterium]|nr:sulfate transporter CysZ [Pseudomonadales bacterium]
MSGNVFKGLGYLSEGFSLISQPGLRLFVVIPLVLNVFLFIAFSALMASFFSGLLAWVMSGLPEWLAFIEWLLWAVYGLVIILLFAYGFVALANFVGAPFYGYLSELTQKKLTGKPVEVEGGWIAFLKSIPRSLLREVHKILYYLPRAILLLILGFVPVINLLAALLWLLFSGWMMAVQYVDYPSDNNAETFAQMKQKLARKRLTALGFGLPVFFAAMVPVLNLIVVPAAVCGATAYWVREEQELTAQAQLL